SAGAVAGPPRLGSPAIRTRSARVSAFDKPEPKGVSPMPHRLSLALLAAIGALVFALPGGARPAQNVLHGVVGPGYSISLTDESGQRVTHLDPGTYTIDVQDKAT